MPHIKLLLALCLTTVPLFAIQIAGPVAPGESIKSITSVHVDLEVDEARVEATLELELAGDSFELFLPLGRDSERIDVNVSLGGEDLPARVLDRDAALTRCRLAMEKGEPGPWLELYGDSLVHVAVPGGSGGPLQIRITRLRQRTDALDLLRFPLAHLRHFSPGAPLTITGELRSRSPLTDPYSPTHELTITQRGMSLEGSESVFHSHFELAPTTLGSATDLRLYNGSSRSGGLLDATVISEKPQPDEPGTFVALIGAEQDPLLIPEPKNVVFVLDRSGSMKGEKWDQALTALDEWLTRLRPEDRFEVVAYAAEAGAYSTRLQAPNSREIGAARKFLAQLAPDGGTNIEAGLLLALSRFDDPTALNQIVFLTDGLPTEGEADATALGQVIQEHNGNGARILAFGVGLDVNALLLDRLAAQSRGLAEYVLPGEDLALAVEGFFLRTRTPLVLDASFTFDGCKIHELEPRTVPDIYGGHRVIFLGRYEQAGAGTLTVRGSRGGQPFEQSFPFELLPYDPGAYPTDEIARLWATRRIGSLVDDLRLIRDREQPPGPGGILSSLPGPIMQLDPRMTELSDEIHALSRRYGILSEYTAFLVDQATDIFDHTSNRMRCFDELSGRTLAQSGGHGVAQACNTKDFQQESTCRLSNRWIDASGREITVDGVRWSAGRTFFQRDGAFIDSRVQKEEPDRHVTVGSRDYFELLEQVPHIVRCSFEGAETWIQVGEEIVAINSAVLEAAPQER